MNNRDLLRPWLKWCPRWLLFVVYALSLPVFIIINAGEGAMNAIDDWFQGFPFIRDIDK